jgi:hypothetical protein
MEGENYWPVGLRKYLLVKTANTTRQLPKTVAIQKKRKSTAKSGWRHLMDSSNKSSDEEELMNGPSGMEKGWNGGDPWICEDDWDLEEEEERTERFKLAASTQNQIVVDGNSGGEGNLRLLDVEEECWWPNGPIELIDLELWAKAFFGF